MIVSFRLADMPEVGNPPITTYHDIFHWFPADHIVYVDFPFNLDDRGGKTRFEGKMGRFVKRFKTDYKQFVICEYFTILLKLIVLEGIKGLLYASRPTASLMRGGFIVKEITKIPPLLRMYVYV